MLAAEFKIQDDFPPVGYDDWKKLVDTDLKGKSFEKTLVTHTYEGIEIQPVYFHKTEDDRGRASHPPGTLSTGWDLRQEHTHPDLTVANHAILEDIQGGVTSLSLRFDLAARQGLDPDDPAAVECAGRDGITAYSVDDLDTVLADVQLDVTGVTLDAGIAFLPTAAMLAALWQRRNISPEKAHGALNADPLAELARQGQLPLSLESALALTSDLAAWTASNYPHVTAVGVDTSAYYEAGATEVQDIAFGAATAVEYLRAMTNAGLDINTAARQIQFHISLGTHHFLAIAKLRAARRVWSRVVATCGGSDPCAMRIHARTSNRVLTHRDPDINLLRNTVGVFAAGIGGAQSITSVPFDSVAGMPDEFSRRLARNAVLILQDEAHLHQVVDPAGGSWFLGELTEQVAERAWSVFQDIERQGGMSKAIQDGWMAEQIDLVQAARAADVARRQPSITGVSELPDTGEQGIVREQLDSDQLCAAAAGRVATARREVDRLAEIVAASVKTAAVVDAAAHGATIGQMARALGFHAAEGVLSS